MTSEERLVHGHTCAPSFSLALLLSACDMGVVSVQGLGGCEQQRVQLSAVQKAKAATDAMCSCPGRADALVLAMTSGPGWGR